MDDGIGSDLKQRQPVPSEKRGHIEIPGYEQPKRQQLKTLSGDARHQQRIPDLDTPADWHQMVSVQRDVQLRTGHCAHTVVPRPLDL